MNKKRGVFILVCAVIALICTAICFCFFPQYICQNVYIENVSGITGQSWFGVSEEISVMEEFIPQQKFLGSIIIYVGEIEKDISLQGKLVDSKGKILK